MSKWHHVKILWSKESAREILQDRGGYIEKQGFHSRCKIKTRKTGSNEQGICWIIAKFKDKTDAMAFKLRWL